MTGYVTSYNGLFALGSADAPVVQCIEIPIIQRDYAQGRDNTAVKRIRDDFLGVLYDAVTSGTPLSLDFVYGDVTNGVLRPLDGQQRLTTLFLLHWFLAWRTECLHQEQGWKQFKYATRPSARRFCECLVESTPPTDACLRVWFKDQHWFLYTWEHDPTIQSMLLMLEAINDRFKDADFSAAWQRLVDTNTPVISFHLLPIEKMGLSDDLYIKMNSRGKPLTPFENFKARFEQILEASDPRRVEEFAKRVDGEWAELLWPYRGNDNIVDDEFLRYFQFVTDICDWHDGRQPSGDILSLAERVYGAKNKKAAAHLDFLVRSFDTWVDADPASVFSQMFSCTPTPLESEDTSRVVLFGSSINLFAECCKGQERRSWSLTLLLYAALLHRLHKTEDFLRRIRVLRNLIEASTNELRAEKMPALLNDVLRIIVKGDISGVSSFNQVQVTDELLKVDFLSEAPGLERVLFNLEDHRLLRGSLVVFDLDMLVFGHRAQAFHDLFADPTVLPVLTGALLAAGDYSRRVNYRFLKLGSGSKLSQWREEILTGASREHLVDVRYALGQILDTIALRGGDVCSALESFTNTWLISVDAAEGLDWRWYFVRYPEMRAGCSGVYASATGSLGYSVCMLDKTAMQSHYRDPYLSAIRQRSGVPEGAVHGDVWQHRSDGPWFTGYETEARWMRLEASGTQIRCVEDGLQLRAPDAEIHADIFSGVCETHGVDARLRLSIPQLTVGDRRLDTEDRVQLGAGLLRALVDAGL